MTKYFLLVVLAIALVACSSSDSASDDDMVLNGTWTGDVMTVTIDVTAGTYEGVGLGQQFSYKLKLLEDNGDSVVFSIGEKMIVAQIVDRDNIVLTARDSEGNDGIPVVLTRKK